MGADGLARQAESFRSRSILQCIDRIASVSNACFTVLALRALSFWADLCRFALYIVWSRSSWFQTTFTLDISPLSTLSTTRMTHAFWALDVMQQSTFLLVTSSNCLVRMVQFAFAVSAPLTDKKLRSNARLLRVGHHGRLFGSSWQVKGRAIDCFSSNKPTVPLWMMLREKSILAFRIMRYRPWSYRLSSTVPQFPRRRVCIWKLCRCGVACGSKSFVACRCIHSKFRGLLQLISDCASRGSA